MNKCLNKTDSDFPKALLLYLVAAAAEVSPATNDTKSGERLNQNYFPDNKTGIRSNEEQ